MIDPLKNLPSFLAKNREDKSEEALPDYLVQRLMQVQADHEEGKGSGQGKDIFPRSYGPYLLEDLLEENDACLIYRGSDSAGKQLVIEVLAAHRSENTKERERFLQLANILATIDNESIMPVLAVHEDTPAPCYTMPLLKGEPLARRIFRADAMSVEEVILLSEQLSQGLAITHEAGLLHQALQPANVFLEKSESGAIQARLMNFGGSRTGGGDAAVDFQFSAPEQFENNEIDGLSNLHSLGGILYAALTKKIPSELRRQLSKGDSNEELPTLRDQVYGVPNWFSEVVDELLREERTQRPRSAKEMSRRLENKVCNAEHASKMNTLGVVLTGILLAVFLVVFWGIEIQKLERKGRVAASEFNIAAELEGLSSGEILRIPEGTFHVDAFDFGEKDIEIVGSGRKSKLIFSPSEEPSIKTAGKLRLYNLVIDCSQSSLGKRVSLIDSSGSLVEIERCRIEQQQMEFFSESFPLIASSPGSVTKIHGSEIYSFHSVIWSSHNGAQLSVNDSVLVAPGVVYFAGETGSGSVTCVKTSCLTEFFASCVLEEQKGATLNLSIEQSAIAASHAVLWFPKGNENWLREGLNYRAKDSLWSINQVFINTNPRPRELNDASAEGLAAWDESDWRDFWGESETGVLFSSDDIGNGEEFFDHLGSDSDMSRLELPKEYQGLGAHLNTVGPF